MLHAVESRQALPRPARALFWGPMSDLLSQISNDRSEEAFRRLYEEFAPRVRSYMVRQGADLSVAEELAQETLLTVWRKAALYSPDKGLPAGWIFTIARNLRIDRLRRETPWQELTEAHTSTIPSDATSPDDAVGERQREQRVRAALKDLPPDQLEIVTLAFIDGLSHSEIAERLSLPLGTVKSRMRLAYQKVRSGLEDLQ